MRINDWLWCWANGYCTKHVLPVEYFDSGCEKCVEERKKRIEDRLKGIKDRTFTGSSIHTI
jgi:hypothetical protein